MSSDRQELLRVENLRVAFDSTRGTVTAVNNVSLTVGRGETVAVVGESGSGKSVTARTIMGLSTPPGRIAGGDVLLDGESVVGLTEAEWGRIRGSRISMVFQDPMSSLNPTMKIGRQIEESLRMHAGLNGADARTRAVELLDSVQIKEPERRAGEYPHQLSGGMRQRVMIALALSGGPDLLIADEPTTALDVTTQREILDLIANLQAELGMAVMLITHDIAIASTFCDTIYVMNGGEVVESGTASEILTSPRDDYTRRLLDSVLTMDSPVHTEPTDDTTVDTDSDILLEVRDLEQEFSLSGPGPKKIRAIDGVSFTVRRGETLSIVGESGSGKSTTARAILQAPPPTGGTVVFDGTDLADLNRKELRKARADLQMVFQDPFSSLNPGWKVRDIIAEPMRVQGIGTAKERATRVEELLDLVGLDPERFSNRTPRQMSGGQAQRVGIARALALRPKLVICDESVSSLDVTIQAQVLDLFKSLGTELGLTYLFIAHDLAVVRHVSDRVGVMYKGRLVELGTCEDIYESPTHPYTVELLAAAPRMLGQEETAPESPTMSDAPPLSSQPSKSSSRKAWEDGQCRFSPDCSKGGGARMHEVTPGHWVACHSTSSDPVPSGAGAPRAMTEESANGGATC